MTTPTRDGRRPRWVLAFLAAVLAVLVAAFGAAPASAATAVVAQTRVGAFASVAPAVVGPSASIGAGQRLGSDSPRAGIVVATGVAAETAPSLKSLAAEVREAGLHPAAQNNRTIAVGVDSEGGLFAGSSNLFDAGQRAALERLGITRVPGSGALHAEEELLRGVPDLQRVGTSVRAPCGPAEHNCALQLLERGVGVE